MATPKFEESIQKLEKIVRQLENGELSLEDSLKAFEEGIKLTRNCEKVLKQAKGKVEKLVQSDSAQQPTPFNVES